MMAWRIDTGGALNKAARLGLCALCASLLMYACTNSPLHATAQEPEKLEVLARLNEARRSNGLPPFAWSPLLDKAAQRHSEDMASKGFLDETGSDGSSPRQRIEAAGYAAWPQQRVWAEVVYAGQGTFDEGLAFFLSDAAQRRILLSAKLREVGIGIAKDNLRTYWTLTFGAQPNLLPIFINEDAAVTNERQVAVMLTQEEAVPAGDVNAIGRVVEVRLSNRPDFAGAEWQPWARLIPFTLDRQPGRHTVYVEMRDGAGRTTIASDDIEYDPNARDVIRPFSPGSVITLSEPVEPLLPTILPDATMAAELPAAVPVVVTLAPGSTDATATAPPSWPIPTAVIVFVQPTHTPTPLPGAAPDAAINVVLTPTPEAALRRFGAVEMNALPMDWLVTTYLVVQAGVVLLGLVTLLRRR